MRKEISRFWGDQAYPYREAIIYLQETSEDKEHYEVEFWDKKKLVENRKMITDGVAHSERYAEDAAENWCMGYIA